MILNNIEVLDTRILEGLKIGTNDTLFALQTYFPVVPPYFNFGIEVGLVQQNCFSNESMTEKCFPPIYLGTKFESNHTRTIS